MFPLETERLHLRELTLADAPFVLELLNEPDFHRFIGDRGVRDIAGAEAYLHAGPMASYARHGFGLWHVSRRADHEPVGICGLLQRDTLPRPDLGYAILARHQRKGYASEAAQASLAYGISQLKLSEVLAITSLENPASVHLLEKLGFHFARLVQLPTHPGPSRLFEYRAGRRQA